MKIPLFAWLRRAPRHDDPPDPVPFEIREIPNADLTEADIPREDDPDYERRVIQLAASFNGYEYWGTFEKCFEVGHPQEDRRLRSLTELRTELFCWFRGFRHDGSTDVRDEIVVVRPMLDEIRDRVRKGVID